MPTQKIDPKVIFASNAPAVDKPPVFGDKTKGWDVARANDGRPTIKEMNKVQQDTDLKILWLNENSVTPYDESIDYPDGVVAIKDGSFKQLVSGDWVEFLNHFANKDEVKRGIANRYDSSLIYNSGERVVLITGDIVKSTVDGNASDPNVDMTGWVNPEKDQSLKNSDFLSVTDYKIYPNTGANLGVKINAADADARSKGKKLYFPTGEYRANGLLPTTSWYGEGKDLTIIKNHSANGFDKFLDLKNNVKPVFFQDITFNGNVNADPVSDDWTGIYDTWFTGSCAFVATNSKNVLFNRCSFRDSKLSPLRVWSGCKNIAMLDCDMTHSRGNFGDGLYIHNSQYVYADRLTISDVTRIGVVFEGNTKNCFVSNINFDYAHHGSINLGGGEFNGGFWAENSSDIYLEDCTAKNSGQFSYLMTTGALLTGITQAKFSLTRCTSDTANYGFLIRSKEDSVTARHVLTDCKSYNSPIAYQFGARYDTDEFILKDCFAEVLGVAGAVNIRAAISIGADFTYRSKLPSLTVENFTIKHSGVDLSKYTDISIFDADVTFLDFARMKIKLVNIHNVDSTVPAYIKNRLSAANTADETLIKDSLCHLTRYRTSIKTQLDNCTIVGGNIISTGKVRINNSPIRSLFSVTSDDLRVNNCDMDFSTASDFFSYSTATSTNKITAKFNNCNFNKDITAGDYSLKLQMDGTNKAKVLINGTEFYNLSDATTATNTHIWIVRSPTSVIYQNVIRDSTAHLQKVNTSVSTSEPAGSTSLALH